VATRDKQRFRKVYPYLRRSPVLETIGGGGDTATIEVGAITFANESSVTHGFTTSFSSAPIVTVVSVDSESNGTANVNVIITSVNTTQVVVETSQAFTGTVHYHAIQGS
jgi:hypothetical protein